MMMLFMLLALLARLGVARGLWDAIAARRLLAGSLVIGLLFAVVIVTIAENASKGESFRLREGRDFLMRSNLLADPSFGSVSLTGTVGASWMIDGPQTPTTA